MQIPLVNVCDCLTLLLRLLTSPLKAQLSACCARALSLCTDLAVGVRPSLSLLCGALVPLHPKQSPCYHSDSYQTSV